MPSELMRATLEQVSPQRLAAYLAKRGWRPERQLGTKGAIWRSETSDLQLLVPSDPELGDYALRVRDVLTSLSETHGESPAFVLRDLNADGDDSIGMVVTGGAVAEGSIPLDICAPLISDLRDLVLAAACSTVQAKASFPGRKAHRAIEYLHAVRLASFSPGSFVVNLESALPPAGAEQMSFLPGHESESPFARQVVNMLGRALEALSPDPDERSAREFEVAVSKGVSANLCDALANMLGHPDISSIAFQFRWATRHPQTHSIPAEIQFSPGHLPKLKRVSEHFRTISPVDEFELVGIVTGLRRDEGDQIGIVVVEGPVWGSIRKIRMELGDPDYHTAVLAHDEKRTIRCRGQLSKRRNMLFLEMVASFEVQ